MRPAMDQVTQVVLAGAAAQVAFGRSLGARAAVAGGLAGFLPDLDVLLRGMADPLFPIEVHRTFTHSLAVVPLGAALTTLLLLPLPRFRAAWGAVFGAAFVGWATHAPLDACTSYGTMLLWPFSRAWIAWDLIAIVDPLFTATLLVGLVLAIRRRRARPAVVALTLALAYLGLGLVQRERAFDAQRALAGNRGHSIDHGRVTPVLGSLLLWRSIYVADGEVHGDGLRLVPFAAPRVQGGGKVPLFRPVDLPADAPPGVKAAFGRFHDFADGFTARTPAEPDLVGDLRYSLTWGFEPLWGIRLPTGGPPAWAERRELRAERLETLLGTVLGTAGEFVPLAATVRVGADDR